MLRVPVFKRVAPTLLSMTPAERPDDEAILAKIEQQVHEWRLTPHMELEVRLGTVMDDGDYKACVSHADSGRLFKAMTDPKSLAQWDKKPDRIHFWYKYYPMAEPVAYNEDEYHPPYIRGQFFSDKEPVYHIIMKSKRVLDLRCVDRPYDLRVSLKVERPIEVKDQVWNATGCKVVDRYTIKHGDQWTYDFSHVGYGKTPEDACKNYQFEVEMEASREANAAQSDRTWAVELLGRARDLLGRYEEIRDVNTGDAQRKRVVVPLKVVS